MGQMAGRTRGADRSLLAERSAFASFIRLFAAMGSADVELSPINGVKLTCRQNEPRHFDLRNLPRPETASAHPFGSSGWVNASDCLTSAVRIRLSRMKILVQPRQEWHRHTIGQVASTHNSHSLFVIFETVPLSGPGSDLHARAACFESSSENDFSISIKQQSMFLAH
jgi:hypothetical protein